MRETGLDDSDGKIEKTAQRNTVGNRIWTNSGSVETDRGISEYIDATETIVGANISDQWGRHENPAT